MEQAPQLLLTVSTLQATTPNPTQVNHGLADDQLALDTRANPSTIYRGRHNVMRIMQHTCIRASAAPTPCLQLFVAATLAPRTNTPCNILHSTYQPKSLVNKHR